jgi:prolyl-tRNA synthetase
LRLEIGPRDLEQKTCVIVRRDKNKGEEEHKSVVKLEDILNIVPNKLSEIQNNLYHRAILRNSEMTFEIQSFQELEKNIEVKPGFYLAYFDDNPKAEEEIKQKIAVTTRCIPFDKNTDNSVFGKCFYTHKPTARKVWFAKSY